MFRTSLHRGHLRRFFGIQLDVVCQSSKPWNVVIENILHPLELGSGHGGEVSVFEGRSQACTKGTADSLPDTSNVLITVLDLTSMCSSEGCAK